MRWPRRGSKSRGWMPNCCWVRRWGASGLRWSPTAAAEVPAAAARLFGEMVRRRLRREPVAYILGRKGFRGLELAVDRRVLIPRPETELLVEAGARAAAGAGARRRHRLGRDRPGGRRRAAGLRGDRDRHLARRARSRPRQCGAPRSAERVRFLEGTLPEDGQFDLILANLPYVAERDWASLQPEVTQWEPREALLAGPDGLDAYRAFIPRCAPFFCLRIAEQKKGHSPSRWGRGRRRRWRS